MAQIFKPIEISKLRESDKGRQIRYTDFRSGKVEYGILSSWNERGLFVRYTEGDTAALSSANMCEFV